MPFSPDTTIRVFSSTAVSPENQPYFNDEASKLSWYNSHPYKLFMAQSYQRELREYARVDCPAAELRGYDMIAWQNAPGERWIFARITGIEFVNPNTTDIFFVTDAMQTWIDQIQWVDCWVEREMVDDDWNGTLPGWQSLMPEGIETGQIRNTMLHDFTPDINSAGWELRVLSAYDTNAQENYSIKTHGKYISGLNEFELTGASELGAILKKYAEAGRLDGIAGIWMFPAAFWSESVEIGASVQLPPDIDGYTPKNSKIFYSEFCTVCISNRMGDNIELAPEYIFNQGNSQRFAVIGSFLDGGGGLLCYPNNYMGLTAKQSMDYGVTLPANIQVAYIGNAFANWVAQNRAPLILEGATSLFQIGAGAVTASSADTSTSEGKSEQRRGISQFQSGVHSALSTIAKIAQKATDPAGAHGQAYSNALSINEETYGFTVTFRTPSAQVAESIDNFFNVFGYKVCRMKKPNVNTRPFWNYVKCSPAIVGGPMTSKDRSEIEAILNNGVTFWNVGGGAKIGDYSMDNRG